MIRTLLLLAVLPCAACSSVIEGRSQEIAVNTNPPGANCTLMREGKPIGTVATTPGTVIIRKTKYDITVECDKAGFMKGSSLDKSGTAGATVGNILLGGGIGWAVDSATGADNKYDATVNMTLIPASAAPPSAPVVTGAGVPSS
jgi:hypothetical protein